MATKDGLMSDNDASYLPADSPIAIAFQWLNRVLVQGSLAGAWEFSHPDLRRHIVSRWSSDERLSRRWAAGDLTPPDQWATFDRTYVTAFAEYWPERFGHGDRWQPAGRLGRALVIFTPDTPEAFWLAAGQPIVCYPFLMAFTPHVGWSVMNPVGSGELQGNGPSTGTRDSRQAKPVTPEPARRSRRAAPEAPLAHRSPPPRHA